MGRALGILAEDETSPCIDFDFNHPMANKGIKLANKLLKRRI
jgi:FKBP-type peptidyl-prolyl cis-trans isomerase 2